MPETVSLAFCMTLPPERAIAYLKAKGYAITWDWEELWQEAQAQAFTVAKVTRLDLLEDFRAAVAQALDEGKTGTWFRQTLEPTLRAKGWWGQQEQIDTDTGEIAVVQLGSPWRLANIYRTNLQAAYMAGRYQAQRENADDRPYWQYTALLDNRTRPSHRALHGKVLRHDDPFWHSFYPPNGWGCRCRVVALSEDNLQRKGLAVESSAGKLGRVQKLVSKRTGELREVASYQGRDPATGQVVTVSPDVGWSYNAGAAAWKPDRTRYQGVGGTLAGKELGD